MGNQTKQNELPEVFVGQVLYREKESRRGTPSEIDEVTVSKIGKKYFYLTGFDERYPIDKKTLQYHDKIFSGSWFQLYIDKQDILDGRERKKLIEVLRKHFDWSSGGTDKNTLEQLRKAAEVLGIS